MAWWDPQTWDWVTLGKTAVGAGFGTAVVQVFVQGLLPIYRDHRQRRLQAAYMAMRLAVTLESYASACSDLISKNTDAPHHPDEEYPDWDVTLPELPPYPDDAEGWRAIDRKLAGRCLNLRNRIHGSQDFIRLTIEYNHDDEIYDTVRQHAASRGLEAWELAKALRQKHGIEEVDTLWDYAGSLKVVLREAEQAIKERRKRNAHTLKDLGLDGPQIANGQVPSAIDHREQRKADI
jgi:hypothetical protein